MPIFQQSRLIGILYLENNLSTGVFTSDRLQVLKLLMAQAAILLENARLYEQLADGRHLPHPPLGWINSRCQSTLGGDVWL